MQIMLLSVFFNCELSRFLMWLSNNICYLNRFILVAYIMFWYLIILHMTNLVPLEHYFMFFDHIINHRLASLFD